MPLSANKQVVMDYLNARASKDMELLDRVVSPEFTHEMVGRLQDRDGLFEEVANFPFSDCVYEIDALVEEGIHVACRYRFRGKAPSGKMTAFTEHVHCSDRGRTAGLRLGRIRRPDGGEGSP